MRRVAIWILLSLLVASVVYALGVQARRLADRNAIVYTDGRSIQIPKRDAPVRSILWTDPVPLPGALNTGDEEHHPALSPDGASLYFARGALGGGADLYVSRRAPEGWSEPEPLSAINTPDSDEITPCVSPDGRSLIYATDRPDGLGGYDLWISSLVDGAWSEPRALPAGVNTPHNDYAPALTPDGLSLYFASNRPRPSEGEQAPEDPLIPPPSAGDYDLYRSGFAGASSTAPSRVDALCSPADDVAPALSPAGDFVYFASSRDGGAGGFDLYRARLLDGTVQDPTPVGAPINSPADELDPALGTGGFELLLSSPGASTGEGDRPDFDILRSESREVFPVVDRSRSAIDWASLWRLFGPWLLWLLLLLALLLLLLKFKSSEGAVRRWRRLGLFARCLLLSVLIHALLLALLGMLRVSTAISDLLDDGASRVRLTTSGGSVSAQLRAGFELASSAPAPTTSARADAASAPTQTTLARAAADSAALEASPIRPDVRETSRSAELVRAAPAPSRDPAVVEVRSPSAGAGDASREAVARGATQPEPARSAHAEARSTTTDAPGVALEPAPSDTPTEASQPRALASATPGERVLASAQPADASLTAAATLMAPPADRQGAGESIARVEPRDASSSRVALTNTDTSAPTIELSGETAQREPTPSTMTRANDARSAPSEPPVSGQAPANAPPSVRVASEAGRAEPSPEAAPAVERVASSDVSAPRIAPSPDTGGAPATLAASASTLAAAPMSALPAPEASVSTPPEVSPRAPGESTLALNTPSPSSPPPLASPEASPGPPGAVTVSSARSHGGRANESPQSAEALVAPSASRPEPQRARLADPSPAPPTERVASSDADAPSAEPAPPDVRAPVEVAADNRAEGQPEAGVTLTETSSRPGITESAAPETAATTIAPLEPERAPDAITLALRSAADAPEGETTGTPAPSIRSPEPLAALPTETLATDTADETPSREDRELSPGVTARAALAPTDPPEPEAAQIALEPVRVALERRLDTARPADARVEERSPAPAPTPPAALAALDLAPMETSAEPETATQDPVARAPDPATPGAHDPRAPLSDHEDPAALAMVELDPAQTPAPERPDAAIPDAGVLDPPPAPPSPALPIPNLAAAPMPVEEPVVESVYPQRAPEARQRLVEQGGGSEQTEKAVADALAWLARNQSRDGRWSSRGFEEFGGRSGDPARYDFDVASTGLALLCFFGADHTPDKPGLYQQTVAEGLAWLLSCEGDPGDFRRGESMYSQGIATIALCEGYAMTRDEGLLPPITRAIEFITGARNDSVGGWRYEPGQAGDTSVLGWMVMAMKSAQRCGIDVEPRALDAAGDWLDLVMDQRWGGRYAYRPGMDATHSMTAEGMFVQQLLGLERQDPRMSGSARYVLQELPRWDAQSPTYAWYYATLALFQHGGGAWTRWNRAVSRELVRAQRDDGPAAGSWDPTDRYARIGGRIYQTAICTLSLEVYYRYLPMYVDEPEVVGGE